MTGFLIIKIIVLTTSYGLKVNVMGLTIKSCVNVNCKIFPITEPF